MAISKDKKPKPGDKPNHSMDKNRPNKDTGHMRSAATIRRLKMYNSGGAVRNRKGKIVSQELQSRDLPSTRIVPDRRWFGNTRVVGQKQLQSFREQMAGKADNPFAVLLRQRKLPLQLLEDPEEKTAGKRARKDVLRQFSFSETFGAKSGQRQKKPRLSSEDFGSMVQLAQSAEEQYVDRAGEEGLGDAYAHKDELEFADARYPLYIYSAVRSKYLDKGQSKRIWAELYKVIDSSDVVIQVLDARDPEGTRCKFLESHLRKNHKDKHLIQILNKVDLVPPWVTKKWLRVLSADFPVLAFRAGLQHPFGMGALLSLLRQIARLRSDKKTVSVGFIGYPNVGKSSVINTLRRKKVCTVAPVPGETKVWQYITLMKRVFLIDCPGVVYAGDPSNSDDAATVLKGVVRIERLEDAASYIPALLLRVKPEYLRRAYKLKEWDGSVDFLEQVARGAGKLTRGAEPDTQTAAKMVLLDWQRGRLPFFTLPPGCSDTPDDSPLDGQPAADPSAAAALVQLEGQPLNAAAVMAAAALGDHEGQQDCDADAVDGSDHGDDEARKELATARDEELEDDEEEQGPQEPAVEVKRVAAAAAGAAREQCKGRMPVKGGFFLASDLGTDLSAANTQPSSDIEASESDPDMQSDDDCIDSDDEGGDYDEEGLENTSEHDEAIQKRLDRKSGSKGRRTDQEDGNEDEESVEGESEEEEGEDGGYGKDGLSWEAVMAQVMAVEEKGSESEAEEVMEDAGEYSGAPGGSGRGVLVPGRTGRGKRHMVDEENPNQRAKSNSKGRKAPGSVQGKGKKQHGKAGSGKLVKSPKLPRGGKVIDEKRCRAEPSKASKQTGKKSKRKST